MRSSLFLRIADDIERRIRTDEGYVLPSIPELAAAHKAAYRTMWKAVQVLVKKGIVHTRQGKKIRQTIGPGRHGASSSDRLFDGIKASIETGDYRARALLPKINYFARTYGVSSATVTQVFRRLAVENLVHHIGHRWVVGPRPLQPASPLMLSNASDMPVALVLAYNAVDWSAMMGESFVNAFLMPCSTELLRHDVIVSPCLRQSGEQKGLALPAGTDEVIAYARSLGDRYAGTIIMSVHPREDDVDEWIAELIKHRKPVIYFDQADQGSYLTRQSFGIRKGYYRLYQDEKSAASLVLEHLAHRGHRAIAVYGTDMGEWAPRRAQTLCDLGVLLTPSPSIACSKLDSAWREVLGPSVMHALVSKTAELAGIDDPFGDGNAGKLKRFREMLLERSPSLVSLLTNGNATALVCLNEQLAREHYFFLKALGIAIPHQFSIISFDSSPEMAYFPISTVDWGFEQLGYLAAHILIGDIPVRADRQGGIPGVCRLADRGSIGKPGDPAEVARLLRN